MNEEEQFALKREPAHGMKRLKIDNKLGRQAVLFTGLQCTRGQQNLIEDIDANCESDDEETELPK